MADKAFLTDIKTLRERARQHIEQGAITEGYSADRETVIKVLNESLATEIVCVLRYRRHHFMASGINAEGVAAEFLQHAIEEQGHADQRPRPHFLREGPVGQIERVRMCAAGQESLDRRERFGHRPAGIKRRDDPAVPVLFRLHIPGEEIGQR